MTETSRIYLVERQQDCKPSSGGNFVNAEAPVTQVLCAVTCDLCGYTWTPSTPKPLRCSRCKNHIYTDRGERVVRRQRFPREFWANVDKCGGLFACWPWTGAKGKDGYGRFYDGSKNHAAHREAYRQTFGEPQHYVCHDCDNPPCCNPAHLYDAPQKQNVHDAIVRGLHPASKREFMVKASLLGLAARRAKKAGAS